MARPLRIQYPGAWYHVTCRGNARANIFRGDKDRRKFLALLEESTRDFSVEVHCYCLLGNHFHLLVKTPLANLDRFMHQFNTAYSVFFNWKHKRVGHLYQGRYKAILVEADNHLLELSRYIHLNPVRLKRWDGAPLKEKIAALDLYPWSSYQAYTKMSGPSFLHQEMILSMIAGGKKNRTLRNRRYREFVLRGLKKELRDPLADKKAHSVLGSDEFIQWVYSSFVRERKEEKEYSRIKELVPSVTVEQIIQAVASEFNVKPEELTRKYARMGGLRAAVIELSCRYLRQTRSLREIGEKLGLSAAGLIRSRERFEIRLKKDRDFRKRFERIEKKIAFRS